MTDQKIEFITEGRKELQGLAKLLLKILPDMGLNFSRRDSLLWHSDYHKTSEATYSFFSKDRKRKFIYDYKLNNRVYTAALESINLPEETYTSVMNLLEEGFPHLIKQKVA